MRFFLITLITLFLSSCATTNSDWIYQRVPINLESEVLDFPELETITEKNLGDTLVVKGIQTKGPAFKIVSKVIMKALPTCNGLMGCVYYSLLENQEEYVSYSDVYTNKIDGSVTSAECAVGFQSFTSDQNGKKTWNTQNGRQGIHSICLAEDGQFRLTNPMIETLSVGIIPIGSIKKTTKTVVSETSFKQELIYNGRLGDGLKFIYREFSGDMARPAFTQDIQYDLNASNIIGFKNVKLEVISATNTVIKYKVISNF